MLESLSWHYAGNRLLNVRDPLLGISMPANHASQPTGTQTANAAPPVSAVIVVYNSADDIGECVRSAAESSVPVEVIVLDNASRDATVRVAEAALRDLPHARLITNTGNLGFAAAANVGLRAAQGDYILFLNPDCVLRHDAVERALRALEADPRAGMAGCLLLNTDGSEQAGARRHTPVSKRSLARTAQMEFDSTYQKLRPS